jgi:hypothetical protein
VAARKARGRSVFNAGLADVDSASDPTSPSSASIGRQFIRERAGTPKRLERSFWVVASPLIAPIARYCGLIIGIAQTALGSAA